MVEDSSSDPTSPSDWEVSSGDEYQDSEHRRILGQAAALAGERDADDDTSPPPDWLSSHQTPTKADILRPDSVEADDTAPPAATEPPNDEQKAQRANVDSHLNALEAAAGAKARPREVPLRMPEKLTGTRLLLEVDAADDVEGDLGTVARLSRRADEAGEMQTLLDWHGEQFSVTERRIPGTILRVHVTPEAAQVDAVFYGFLQRTKLDDSGDERAQGSFLAAQGSDDEYLSDVDITLREIGKKKTDKQGEKAKRPKDEGEKVTKRAQAVLGAAAKKAPAKASKKKPAAKKPKKKK